MITRFWGENNGNIFRLKFVVLAAFIDLNCTWCLNSKIKQIMEKLFEKWHVQILFIIYGFISKIW